MAGDVKGLYKDPDMKDYLVEMMNTYFLCGVGDASTQKKKLNEGKNAFGIVKPGQMAFVVLTLLNNFDLFEERSENCHDPAHACHKKKGGVYTSKTNGGGDTFHSGFNNEGKRVQQVLLVFFVKLRQHELFPDLEKMCAI